jgi:hypothetical protein
MPNPSLERLSKLSYGLAEAATSHYTNGHTPLDRVLEIGATMVTHLSPGWNYGTSELSKVIKARTYFACMPSFITIVNGQVHTSEVAEDVLQNVQGVATGILQAGLYERVDATNCPASDQKNIAGSFSELAVLGLLWWSVVNGRQEDTTYISPATSAQDTSVRKEGLRSGYDMSVKQSGVKGRRLIQVKSGLRSQDYHPTITVVPTNRLAGERAGSRILLRALAEDDLQSLGHMFDKYTDICHEADEKLIRYLAYKEREAARQDRTETVRPANRRKNHRQSRR